jgi:nitrogen-specific signal transduction histidine kinase
LFLSPRIKLWGCLLAALVLAQIAISLAMPQGTTLTLTSDLIQGALLLAATAAYLSNTLPSRCPARRTRGFWILMSGSMLFWLMYQGMWIYFEVIQRQDVPEPFSGDVVLFLHLVPMTAALAVLPHLRDDERDARIRILDLSLLLTWWVFLYVYAVIPWQTVQVDGAIYGANFNLVYLAEKLVLLVSLAIVAYTAHGDWRHLYGQLLGASALYASSSYVANWAIVHGSYYSGSIYDIPLTISIAWIGMVAVFAARWDLSEAKPSRPILGVWISRLGMLAIFSLPGFALYALLQPGSPAPVREFRILLTLVMTVVMGAMVFRRQSLLGSELSRLLDSSRRSFDDLKNLQGQLIQSERLASLGQLVGGAAHEINNPLAAMLGYSDILCASGLPPQEQQLADHIAEQVRRTKMLVASLLTFARETPSRMTAVDVNSVLQTAMRLIAPQLETQNATLGITLGTSLPLVLADSNQLLQVCLHLAGQITSQFRSAAHPGLYVQTRRDDSFVVLDFRSNTSSGEPYQALQTSEGGHKPSTLSLNACCRIVEEHGGRILTQMSQAGYAAFRLELPVVTELSSGSSPAVINSTGATADS